MNINIHPERKRGKLLSMFLIFSLVANPSLILFYVVSIIDPTLRQAVLSQGELTPELNILLSICSFAFAFAIWKWKKWGVYGFIIIYLIEFVIIMSKGQDTFQFTLFWILGIIFSIFLFRPVWRYME